jgi:hypothetical protein
MEVCPKCCTETDHTESVCPKCGHDRSTAAAQALPRQGRIRPSPTPWPDQKSLRPVWVIQGFAGMILVVAGMAILVASLIIRDGNLTGKMLTFPYAGLLTRVVGTLVLVLGMALLGKGGMVKFGCILMIGGAAAYLGNLLINQEVMGLANGLGGLAALLGLILVAVANGWLGQEGS